MQIAIDMVSSEGPITAQKDPQPFEGGVRISENGIPVLTQPISSLTVLNSYPMLKQVCALPDHWIPSGSPSDLL